MCGKENTKMLEVFSKTAGLKKLRTNFKPVDKFFECDEAFCWLLLKLHENQKGIKKCYPEKLILIQILRTQLNKPGQTKI